MRYPAWFLRMVLFQKACGCDSLHCITVLRERGFQTERTRIFAGEYRTSIQSAAKPRKFSRIEVSHRTTPCIFPILTRSQVVRRRRTERTFLIPLQSISPSHWCFLSFGSPPTHPRARWRACIGWTLTMTCGVEPSVAFSPAGSACRWNILHLLSLWHQ